ncbi:hypothetical protein BCV72DRAFT_274142 [Rhizopus microsporus var. microsporus]|uniref:GRIP domain-containing protein n=2 Tax=Rhizopus microsporus TaxID=58291 RepID=A0A2G4T310_RHIZD|nr:uncharacterized protein RHIMIDRAFT_274644 [Rhizopus microsporus ATCC 52813]XP_023468764.1 uncharacterized protein RHIMIDRAFT_277067 [Rhizopus microsporus ATCC 52813]ORE06900.1 hypothetical protein BCV72DRAFT_274142 [Rhizopus microsporus var. microsporus]PHZ07416.1 hypothetical protein RHIMIDRAFT_274644 [Rhizopus microsporus ATCC 52813]PHZ15056.1 hypothetical protein RHIMIDRAFT_277067 [Rhizopus microsporus ATCC 52813]
MARKQLNTKKRNVQEQIRKLKNEIEELKLEREENKKSVLHFMQEADSAQKELKKAQETIKQLIEDKNEGACHDSVQCMAEKAKLAQEIDQAKHKCNTVRSELECQRRTFEQLCLSVEQEKIVMQNEVSSLREKYISATESISCLELKLGKAYQESKQWQEKYDDLYMIHVNIENQKKELEYIKAREIQLKAMNKMLRNEIRRMTKAQDDALNLEYLRNVIIKFLELKTTRSQLIPVLSSLLQCTHEDQTKLHQIVQNNIIA